LVDLASLVRQVSFQLLNPRGGRLVLACRRSVAFDSADPSTIAVVTVGRRRAAAVRLHTTHDGQCVVERRRLLIQNPGPQRRVGQRLEEGVAADDFTQLARVTRKPERQQSAHILVHRLCAFTAASTTIP
jgi:hypothetical protein